MPIKILSVDDEVDLEMLLTQYFRRKIRKGEYEFYFAHNGIEGLQVMLQHPDIDIVLSDINMPEMDGLAMLAKIHEMQNPALKCIMVSAYGDMDNIRQAMNGGAFDFATKPIDLEDLERTIEKAIEQIRLLKQYQEEHKELVDIQEDLNAAQQIQKAILPSKFPPFPDLANKLDIYASMHAAKEVGGDFYDFFQLDDHRIGFVMADVSGKGVPAALFMAVSRTVIRANGTHGLPSHECLAASNSLLCDESLDLMFVTTFYGIFDTLTGEIDYCNAGHNPPYILRANGTLEMLPFSQNMALGVFDQFPFTSAKIQLEPGDAFITFTDGITEAYNHQNGEYGEARLEALLPTLTGKTCQEMMEAITANVQAFVDGDAQSDDITQLILKRL